MAQGHPHLRIEREEPVTERRPSGRRITARPADPIAHGEALRQGLRAAKERSAADIGGFDERRLFRFSVEKGFDPEDLLKVSPEIEFVSHEAEEVVVAFVSDAALESFEARLSSLVHGEKVPYKMDGSSSSSPATIMVGAKPFPQPKKTMPWWSACGIGKTSGQGCTPRSSTSCRFVSGFARVFEPGVNVTADG
jgi:hypothetical protein